MATEGPDTLTGNGLANSIDGKGGADLIDGRGGSDLLVGGAGDDTLIGGAGDDTLSGGDGKDTISYLGASAGVFVDLRYGASDTGSAGVDHFSSIERVIGSDFADTIFGAGGRVDGGLGDDTLLTDGSTSIKLVGGGGDDAFAPFTADATVLGGAGVDSLDFTGVGFAVTYYLGVKGAQFTGAAYLTTDSVERIRGSQQSDTFIGSRTGDTLWGEGADDTLAGGAGGDVLDGGPGANLLLGQAGADTLYGGSHADRFTGGAGADFMSTGGAGADIFRYDEVADSTARRADTISGLDGDDVIDLKTIDAVSTRDGNQAFRLVDAFSGRAGELAISFDGGSTTRIAGDVDGDGQADLVINLDGDYRGFAGLVL